MTHVLVLDRNAPVLGNAVADAHATTAVGIGSRSWSMIWRKVATCSSSGGRASSSERRAVTQCSNSASCSMTVGTALAFSSGLLQSRSSPALMLDATSKGQPASRHTRSSDQPSS